MRAKNSSIFLPQHSSNIIQASCSNCQAIGFAGYKREREQKNSQMSIVLFFLFCLILSSCFSRFLGTLNFWKILLRSSLPPRATAIKTASLWVYARAHTHTHIMNWFVFFSMTSRNIIQRKLVFSPVGWKSWRVANISIKIMQSVELWLSFCGIVTVSFPSINLALCRFVASSLLNCPIRRIHFSQLFKKCPGFVFLNKWWHTHILWMCDMIVYISSIFKIKTF